MEMLTDNAPAPATETPAPKRRARETSVAAKAKPKAIRSSKAKAKPKPIAKSASTVVPEATLPPLKRQAEAPRIADVPHDITAFTPGDSHIIATNPRPAKLRRSAPHDVIVEIPKSRFSESPTASEEEQEPVEDPPRPQSHADATTPWPDTPDDAFDPEPNTALAAKANTALAVADPNTPLAAEPESDLTGKADAEPWTAALDDFPKCRVAVTGFQTRKGAWIQFPEEASPKQKYWTTTLVLEDDTVKGKWEFDSKVVKSVVQSLAPEDLPSALESICELYQKHSTARGVERPVKFQGSSGTMNILVAYAISVHPFEYCILI